MNLSRIGLFAAVGTACLLAGCERPPMQTAQLGYRGLGMEQVTNPRLQEARVAANQPPAIVPPVPQDGPPASSVFKNVPQLGHLSIAEFTRTMIAITNAVSPNEGCVYCHKPGEDLSSDSLYTKVVSRRMIEMTQNINGAWKSHVGNTGVACYTCHRGNHVPPEVWFRNPGPPTAQGMAGNRAGQNFPAPEAAMASLPFDPLTPFLDQRNEIRVVSTAALPGNNYHSIKQTEWTYALMMNMSDALGVNCTYCHNSRSFMSWDASTPARTTSWYGIRMVRDLNRDYLDPLAKTLPANRLGPLGDAPKVDCGTCHAGVSKPLLGARIAQSYPAFHSAPKATSATPPPEVTASLAVVYFAVGSPDVHAELPAALSPIVAALKANARAQATISGYHSATGDAAMNHELAKTRAMRVQAILVAQGIPEARIILVKPVVEQANVAGEDPKARRVEVSLQ
jgi:photosynthetic reaction center cytochrome c subunit